MIFGIDIEIIQTSLYVLIVLILLWENWYMRAKLMEKAIITRDVLAQAVFDSIQAYDAEPEPEPEPEKPTKKDKVDQGGKGK